MDYRAVLLKVANLITVWWYFCKIICLKNNFCLKQKRKAVSVPQYHYSVIAPSHLSSSTEMCHSAEQTEHYQLRLCKNTGNSARLILLFLLVVTECSLVEK
jgi:hypothetical protein